MKKRLLSVLLTVCMVLTLLPGATLTASASEPTDYNLRVGGVQVTSENCANITGPGITGSVSYNPSTSTLTLNGANITGFYSINQNDAGIYTSRDLTIDLVNANSITPGMSGRSNQNSAGIYVFASNLTISSNSGNGTLSVASNDTTADSTGIYSEWGSFGDSTANITISGGEITVSGGTSSGAGSQSNGIQAWGNLTISGGEITATGGTAGGISRGIYVFKILSVTGNATVLAIGGRPGSGYSSFGIQAPNGNSFVSGGAVTATGGDGGSESYGISTNTYTLSITGGTVTAKTNAVPGENKKAVNTATAIDISTYAGVKILVGNTENAAKVVGSYSNEGYVKFGTMDTYTVTYDGNGGGGSMTAETAAAGVPFPLPACGFTEPAARQAFHKWAVGSTGGTQVEANDSHTFTADTTVYAFWKAATPATTFSFDGANANQLMDTTTQMQYSLDGGGTWTTCSDGSTDLSSMIASITETNDLKVKRLGDGTTADSYTYTITINKAATPSAGKADCTTLANDDGKLTGVTTAMEYKLSTADNWISGTGSDIIGLAPGTYLVRVKARMTTLASDNQSLSIGAYSAIPATTPATTFSFDGANANQLMNTTTQMQYSLDGGSTWANCSAGSTDLSGVVATISESNDIKVKDLGNAVTTTVSGIQTIDITKAATPSAGKTDCTTVANNDGKLTGVTAAMEYKISTDVNWIGGTGSDITGLANGTYYVRVKAAGTVRASDNHSLIISAYTPPSGGGGGGTPALVTRIDNGGSVTGTNVANLVKEGQSLTVEGKTGEKLVFDTEALKNIDGQTKESLKVEIKDVSADHAAKHPDRLVVSLTVTAGGKHITNFGNGTATVSLPYELKPGEKAADVTVWYLAEDGSMTEVPCTYDPVTKLATFKVNHFSLYVVGTADLSTWANPFGDVKQSDWFYGAVRYASANGLMQGTKGTAFSPDTYMTRGMLVTILWRMENEPAATAAADFTDIAAGKWYTQAVTWAAKNEIVTGHAGKFNPDDAITREQLAAILHRYATYKDYAISKGANLDTYPDTPSDWALSGVSWAVAEGLLQGSGGRLAPEAGATRAQAAAVLQRFIDNIANETE